MNFKDPDSLKVISSEVKGRSITVIITATNSYGARTQGKIFCELNSKGHAYAEDKAAAYGERLQEQIDRLRHENNRSLGLE